MSLTIREVSEVLRKYYPGQEWRCAEPISDAPPVLDELGNLISGLQWFTDRNTVPRPTVAELEARWAEFRQTGEYIQQFPALPKDLRGPFIGKTSEYAQALLTESDWAALPDTQLANQDEWNAYRAALRAIRSNPTENPTWPTRPRAIFV
jgi:hypothetical protein